MGKRKLTRRQQVRIEKRQLDAAKAPGAGDDSALAARVISNFGRQVEIEWQEGDRKGARERAFLRANLPALVVGDEVFCAQEPGGGTVVTTLQDRRSLLQRPDKFGHLRPVAANVDCIAIVLAPEPPAHADLIDRYLVAAELAGIEAHLVFNKTDLLSRLPSLPALLNRYVRLGYETFHCSRDEPQSYASIRALFASRIGILVGQSGVGKSSLIAEITGDAEIRIGALSEAAQKGRHTTTTSRLYPLPGSGLLIDTPGIREFGLWHVEPDQLIFGFREFVREATHCQFRNCRHFVDPGCGLAEACREGRIHPQRRDSYLNILNAIREDGVVMRSD